jgi:hypothetical protein
MTRLLRKAATLLFLSLATVVSAASGAEYPAPPPPVASVRQIIPTDTLPPITVGPYKYDGAGNIIHMGADRYTYDEMSRLTSGTAVTDQNGASRSHMTALAT